MQQLMQRAQWQPTSTDKCIMLPQQYSDDPNPGAARNYWVALKNYLEFYTRQESINLFDELKNMFALILTDIVEN